MHISIVKDTIQFTVKALGSKGSQLAVRKETDTENERIRQV